MEKFVINGGKELHGEVEISGAKNAAVAIIPATILAGDVCRIENIPDIRDVQVMVKILIDMGAAVRYINLNTLEIDTRHITSYVIPYEMTKYSRSSYYLLGALLGRYNHAKVAMPGGCNFGGVRPIDFHLKGFAKLGAAISNDNLQDLKTGYIVGATPWKQQVALILGSVIGAIAIAPVLNLLYQAYGFTGALPRESMDPSQALSAPQATLMTTIAQGIFSSSLDWDYILLGIGVGIVVIIIDLLLTKNTKALALPPLAVGMGIYLPPTLEIPLVIGSVIGYFVHKHLKARAALRSPGHEEEDVEACSHRGVLFASGLIVGESLMGVIIALLIVVSVTSGGSENPLALVGKEFKSTADILGLVCFIGAIALFVGHILSTKFTPEKKD